MTFSRSNGWTFTLAAVCLSTVCMKADAGDWPAWRHDAARSGATGEELGKELHLQWIRELPELTPAWPDQAKLQFDRAYQPIVAGGRMFVGSPRNDTVTAYAIETGKELWTFHAGGPVRFAPVAHEGKIYFASDDGYLYCLDTDDGEVAWKFRGGPRDRWILGNNRLISTWPARGGPVVADGTVYFAAGIWPFMGIFLHALDAETGEVIWTNDGDGSMFIKQPHNSDSFAGVAPQGPLVVAGDLLLVPGGRSVPAIYNRHTGRMVYYRLAENSKRAGGWAVSAMERFFFNGGYAFEAEAGDALASVVGAMVFDNDVLYLNRESKSYAAFDLGGSTTEEVEVTDRRGRKSIQKKWSLPELWSADAPGGEVMIKAGSRLYSGSTGRIVAVDLPESEGDTPTLALSWETSIDGMPDSLLAADGRLFAVTREGRIYCFGAERAEPLRHAASQTELARDNAWRDRAAEILNVSKARGGYAICWGAGTGGLVRELLAQSDLYLIIVEAGRKRADELRQELIESGLYGTRASVHVGKAESIELAPHLASLIVSEDVRSAGIVIGRDVIGSVYETLRPHGGVAVLATEQLDGESATSLQQAVSAAELDDAQVASSGAWTMLASPGALPGAADWTHEHADASNTRVSKDSRVKAPLGLLWFGGPSHKGILPRHGHGPQPQTVEGRLIIEGVDMMRAVDQYTGRLLWERELPGVGFLFDISGHQPGANGTGTNYISTPDGVYMAYGARCLKLDLDTGETLAEFELPPEDDAAEPPHWGYLNVSGDYLIAGAEPYVGETDDDGRPKRGQTDNHTSSKRLVVMDRHSGEVLWSAEAENHFRHNAVCVGGGRLYCVDLLSAWELARLERRGQKPDTKSKLAAYYLANGELIWSSDEDVFGTWLSYSQEHDVLVESGRQARDVLRDEKGGMRAFSASDGAILWRNDERGPAIIHGREVLVYRSACDLLTGEPVMREDPVTGEEVPWTWMRNYGCNTPMASEHLLTFRSGAAGFFDLARDGGTGNFGGFRSGCTNNLIVAGGLLNAPDYTRTCVCSYQNQTSLALIHMPEAEVWTQFPVEEGKPLHRLGLNLGAPGARRVEDGLLWLNAYDSVKIEHEGDGLFIGHSSKVSGEGLPWVAASGCRGVRRVVIETQSNATAKETARFTVRLHFADPDNDDAERRMFDVRIQGEVALDNFDIAAVAGGRNRAIVREFPGIEVRDQLTIEFAASDTSASGSAGETVLCGLEVWREE